MRGHKHHISRSVSTDFSQNLSTDFSQVNLKSGSMDNFFPWKTPFINSDSTADSELDNGVFRQWTTDISDVVTKGIDMALLRLVSDLQSDVTLPQIEPLSHGGKQRDHRTPPLRKETLDRGPRIKASTVTPGALKLATDVSEMDSFVLQKLSQMELKIKGGMDEMKAALHLFAARTTSLETHQKLYIDELADLKQQFNELKLDLKYLSRKMKLMDIDRKRKCRKPSQSCLPPLAVGDTQEELPVMKELLEVPVQSTFFAQARKIVAKPRPRSCSVMHKEATQKYCTDFSQDAWTWNPFTASPGAF